MNQPLTDTEIHKISDPVERVVALSLRKAGIAFIYEPSNGLDFEITEPFVACIEPIYIECKQFHSDRISEQMSRVSNVIVIQGMIAALAFNAMLFKALQRTPQG